MMFGFYASIDPKEDLSVKVAGEKDAEEGPARARPSSVTPAENSSPVWLESRSCDS